MIKIRDGLMGKVGLELKFNTWVEGLPRRRQWHPTPVLLPGKSHGWRSLVGCSPWGRWGSDTTERLHLNFSLSCTGEGNGNPLQCSCLEHPRDGGAWWAAVYGVAQSRTRLKWLSSSSAGCGFPTIEVESWNRRVSGGWERGLKTIFFSFHCSLSYASTNCGDRLSQVTLSGECVSERQSWQK